ncbi:transmembrane protein 80 isoform X2 [Paramormyrops kingsleyae]|uniref:transmembrane protein 80 isoform X2 n=1 Tax=Paramormyrops kingsleyae TaxID=1676925 RepID=UPI000CD63BA1|nr:transmembrane protein 80 isoform X2 [Paramormyrops kingsleyae]
MPHPDTENVCFKMAAIRSGRTATVLSSVSLQLLLYLSAVYSLFYFLGTLSMIIYKSQALSYPGKILLLDVCLLLLMAVLETLRLYWGVRGNLQESERCVGFSLALTLATTLFAVYFLLWQAYVLQADIIIGAVLLVLYGLSGALGLVTLARFMR